MTDNSQTIEVPVLSVNAGQERTCNTFNFRVFFQQTFVDIALDIGTHHRCQQ